MGLRDSRGEVSKQINFLDFQLECLEHRRTPLIYKTFGSNRLIETIDVTMERSIVDCFENIAAVGSSMEGPDDLVDKLYKNA